MTVDEVVDTVMQWRMRCAQAEEANKGLAKERTQISAEKDTLAKERDALALERDRLKEQVADLEAEAVLLRESLKAREDPAPIVEAEAAAA